MARPVNRHTEVFDGQAWLEKKLATGGAVGWDMEWTPDTGGREENPVALMQFADAHTALLLRTHRSGNWLPKSVRDLLLSKSCQKVTLGYDGSDRRKVQTSFGLEPEGVVDLQAMAEDRGFQRSIGLKKLGRAFGLKMYKDPTLSISFWEASSLSEDQVRYAADDAFFTYSLYDRLLMFQGSGTLGAETEDESFEGPEDPDDEASLLFQKLKKSQKNREMKKRELFDLEDEMAKDVLHEAFLSVLLSAVVRSVMDIVPFAAATGNNVDGGIGGRQEHEANQYFLHLLQENTQVNVFLNDHRIQSALEHRAEQRHRFALDNVCAEANAYIAHLEATADANHRQQLAFVSQSTHLLVGQLHNEVRVLETIARAERQSANELQAQLARAQRESHDERSMALQLDAHRSELEAAARTLTAENRQHERRFAELRSSIEENHSEMIAFLGSEFEEKLQWEENEFYHRLTSEVQQYDSLVDDLQDRNAELIAEVDSLRTVLSTAESSPPQGGAVPVKVDPSESSKLQPSPPQGGAAATSPATLSSVGSAHEVISGGKGGKGGDKKDTSKIPCIFYPKGTCKNGKNCPFMHKDAAPSVPAKGDKAGKDGKRSPSGKRRRPSKKRPKSEDKPAACCFSLTATLTGEPSTDAGKVYAVAARKGPAESPEPERYKSAEQCPPSIPEDTEEALQNARPLMACLAAKSSESDGSKESTNMNLKVQLARQEIPSKGWTVINGSPAAKVAHFPKTFRTPDDVWSLLEDSVNIDELDGIYGEVPEGTIATITLFALPEGEVEAQADSDVEPYTMPKSKKDEASLRAEAEGGGYDEATIQEQLSEDLDEMFPELFGPDRDKDPPPKDAKEATRKGESKPDSRAALLDDVPFSVKQKLKSSAAVAAQEPPYGYAWSGECLVKKNNKNRPNAIDHTAWKTMSKRQRATAIAEHEKKLHEENEALCREAVKGESEEVVVDSCNQMRDRCLQDWWDGETYFDLAGREQSDFELAVAAARKGKPVRNKSEAKKEAKQSKFVTLSQDMKLLNVGTAEQVADVFTKPFTEKNKWTHALKLIGHTTSANIAGCKPESKVEVDNKVSVAAAPDAAKIVEDFAKQSFEANDYSFKTFEKLAGLIRTNLKASLAKPRSFMASEKISKYLVFGAWVHGGCFGITNRTKHYPWICRYVNEFVKRSSPKGFTWTSFVFNFNGKARIHTDKYNQKESYNLTFSFGNYTGGTLWIEGASQLGPPGIYTDDHGKDHKGYNCNTYRKPTLLHPSTKHGVQPYTGERHSFIAYSSGGYQKFNKKQKQFLHQSQFLLPTAQLKLPAQKAMVCLRCVGSPLDEGGRLNKPCSRFENDSFARTSLECTNTQQAASLDHEILASFMCTPAIATSAGSDLPDLPEATSTIPRMAAIVVSDEFCRVNTSEADRAGVTKAMKTLLQSAALNNDIISLGADHESQLLESAYSCVSTQCAAGVSLTHADATCVALRQMADLSDEGLAKLKPTARLSPKAKRAIIVVSDSSTALCKKNRRGVFVKADLDAEVNIASMTLGWAQTRYTMCWGKTLAWIVWQVEEHIKELRINYPGHTIDVLCWWCGNEISGQWGCIPTRLGPGLAYRDPNVTTETVARKVRRAADVLAALAGEPDIGFVKVIGQVEADLFQLHSAYNDFNAAMFEEFRQRGLQVQAASYLVEKLEMYDSFHASEDPRNRELFQTYLHATFNASRSEWLAQKMTPCVRALLARYEHFETGSGANNPVLEDVFQQWRAERDQLMNPKQAKPMPVTQEDKMWEAPDAADATDVTKVSEGPPMDKAIRKDVPRIGATTDVSSVAECVNDIVTQDADGKVSYNTPGTVELVDEGDQVDPIPSSIGRVIEPAAPKKTKKSDCDEDAMRRLMFIDESAPQGAATVPELPNEYFYNGAKHLMKPFNPEDIVGDRHVTFKHGDLKFLTKLLRGHELENFPALIFDRGCWTDVDTLLQVFNTARNARWGPLFPVRVRMAQGHNSKLIGNNPDADFFLATRFYSGLSEFDADLQSSVRGVTVLSRDDTPSKLYHRTNEKGMKGILRDGMIAGSARSDRSHNYLSPYRLDDTNYKSGMRSNQPIEMTIDTQRAIAAGCVFFVTETDGVLTRDNVPPDCVLSAVDTSKKNKNLPLYVAEPKEAAREGEPERIFRAKRDYEEAATASSSSAPPPKQAAIAPKAIASKKMPKVAPKPAAIVEKDEVMDLDEATREGEPADAAGFAPDETEVEVEVDEGDTTDAGEDEPYPLGSHPCRECAAVVANGMLFCLRCKAPQTDDSKKITKRVFENSRLRERLLATAATGAQKPIDDLLASDLRGLGDGPKKRGQMSAEAAAIRDAKDRKIRAAKLNFDTVSDRFEKDAQFNVRMMQEGRNFEDMQKFDHLSNDVLPDPGRSEEQRYLRAGSHYGGGNVPPAKLVYYAHCEVEPLRNLRFIDDTADVPIGLTYLGAFLPPRLYAEVAAVNDAAKRILTFDGEVYVSATTTEGITTEIGQILTDSLRSAQNQTDQTERLAERNRQAAVQNRPSQKGRGRTTAPEPMYRGYTQAQWDEYYRQRRGGYTQAEWDAWNRTHRR
ncbi:Wrn [Symbiodinium sp. CCMP2592]|nr:Wrn [Symbiodinium sp. CCMP2592]